MIRIIQRCSHLTKPGQRYYPKTSIREFRISTPKTSSQLSELFGVIGNNPAIIAITSGGGVGLLAALYKNPHFWKVLATATTDRSVLVLPQKPSHEYQPRESELKQLDQMVKQLTRNNKGKVANVIYVTGQPGHGKTQLVREYAKRYFSKSKRMLFHKQFVGTLNASSKSSLINSYISLAMELGCQNELRSLNQLTGVSGEFQSLELLSDLVRKELKMRSSWLLIIDNLNTAGGTSRSSSGAGSVQYEGGYSLAPTVPLQQNLLLPSPSVPNSLNVGVSYGIPFTQPSWNQYWPHPGSESWGNGVVMVTTCDRSLVQTSSPFVKELFLKIGMAQNDAVSLLQKVSGCHGDGSVELVNLLERVPLAVASAGFYIKSERSRNPEYGFVDYQKSWDHGLQEEGEKMLGLQNRSYPVTMKMAVTMAAEQLASDPALEMVFTVLSLCAQSPIPMSLVSRALGVRPNINSTTLESVRQCVLLQVGKQQEEKVSEGGSPGGVVDVEKVSVYRGTRLVLRELCLGLTGEGVSVRNESTVFSTAGRNYSMIHHIINCLINEYENARSTNTVQSHRLQHLMIPHLEAVANGHSFIPGFKLDPTTEGKLLSSLGDAYILKGNPRESCLVLEKGLKILKELDKGRSMEAAQLGTRLGVAYRQLGMLKQSEFILRETLSVFEKEGDQLSLEVGEVLTLLSGTLKSLGRYHESKDCLENSLKIFESVYGSKHITVATVLTNLGSTWRSLGDSLKSKELFERALDIEQQTLEPMHPMIAATLGNLSVAYTDLGNPSKSVELLNQALMINRHIHGQEHISSAITLSQLSNAYRHLGDMEKSKSYAQEALEITKDLYGPLYPGMAVALGVLGSTYLEMGEVTQACELLETSITINRTIFGQKHPSTATVETQLGNALRLGGKLRQSKDLLESTLATKEEVLEKNHPSLAVTLSALGKAYHELGYYTQSMASLHRGREILEQIYPMWHPQVLFIEADLARVLRDTSDLQMSAKTMNNAINSYSAGSSGYTQQHPKYASMLAIHGLILRDLNELSDAESFLWKALDLQEKILSPHNLMKAETLCNLGTVQHRLGQETKALGSLESSLDMMNQLGGTIGHMHPLKSTVLIALGRLLLDMDQVVEGRANFGEGFKIRLETCGEIHPNLALYYELMGRMNGYEQRHSDFLSDAIRIYTSLLQREERLATDYKICLPVLDRWERKIKELELLS